MTPSRRLAAILAADVVGYSRLMGEDEAGTAKARAQAVRDLRDAATPIVAAHGGHVFKTMGDGILIHRYLAQREHIVEGLRLAGMPEG
jgi:class 3 adenylate cyclase